MEARVTKQRYWGASFSPEAIEAARSQGRLLSMELELTRRCNLRCVYCYASAGESLQDELSYAELCDAVDQAAALGAQRIIVLGGGEPLVYPQLPELLRFIHGRGLAIDLFTNGALLTPELAALLFELRAHPVIKMNSLKPAVQDALAGRSGAFPLIRRGLELLLAAGYPRPELPLGVQTVICAQNYAELPEMWAWIRERHLIPYFETITLQGRAAEHPDLCVSPADLRRLFETLAALDAARFGLDWSPRPPIAGLCCSRHLYTCTVTVTGDVLPCPGVNIAVGNIRRTPLAEILAKSPVIQDLRDIRNRIKGKCRTCEDRERCYGCRGMAYQATGDYLAEDPLCWREQS
jgi:radical SAM protein with 4Fe4S-binding SPASM domain